MLPSVGFAETFYGLLNYATILAGKSIKNNASSTTGKI